MTKRAHESAFSLSAPGGMRVTTRSGFNTPQPLVQLNAYASPGAIFVPGQWPLEHDAVSESTQVADDATASAKGSLLYTVGKWAVTRSVTSLLALPIRLVQRFFCRQQILVQPIVREDGARKKRIIDAGLADEPSTQPRRRVANSRNTRPSSSPSIWSPSPSPASQPAVTYSLDIWPPPSPAPAQQHCDPLEDVANDSDVDMDYSLDWSWTDVDSSSTPPFGRVASSSQSTPPTKATYSLNAPTTLSAFLRTRRIPEEISPNTHRQIIEKAPMTPMRKRLVRNQLTVFGASTLATVQHTADNTVSTTPSVVQEPTKLQRRVVQTPVLKLNEQYKAQAEARQNNFADIPIDDPFNHVETVDQDLSWLSDAPNDTLYSPISPTPKKRSVRWSSHANAKSFYCDEKIADAMDSTIETIIFSPVKPSDGLSGEDTPGDDAKKPSNLSPSPSPSPTKGSNSPQSTASAESIGFTGVPASTWEDSEDSLEESQISLELLDDLHLDLQKKLALAPKAPTPPPVKALVTPLSSEEREQLDAVVAKTENGRNPAASIIEYKLNARDFSTLLPAQFSGDPRAWLNDNIVNEYLTMLIAHKKKEAGFHHKRGGPAPPVHAFSSFWYSTIKSRPKGVERWAAKVQLDGPKFLESGLILYPICDAGHWRLLVVKPQERTIEYLDSLGWNGQKYIDTLQDYLAKELGPAYVPDEWTVLTKQRSTRQVNGSDCGVFTVLNALALLRGEEFTKVLSCDGMADARDRIATTLLAGRPTAEFD